ncbi:MAG: glycosyltransferase [Spirulinaceae cyanobacterium]
MLLPSPLGAFQINLVSTAKKKLSLILPTYNESKNLPLIIPQLISLLDSKIPENYELIVVDDDSPDKTWEIAQSLLPKYSQLKVIRRQEEKGLSTAVIRGWQASQGKILGVIDADLQHPPEILLSMLNTIEEGRDLVIASRHIEGGGVSDWSFSRRFLSRGAQTLGLVILPEVIGKVSDPMSGYFLVKREAIAQQKLNPRGYKILIEVLARCNIGKIAEVGYIFQERQAGESKVTYQQYWDYLLHLISLRLYLWQTNRFIRFGLVGLTGVLVDMSVLYLLSDPSTFAWGLTRSKIIAGEVAIINNFLWNDAWTFADIAMKQKGWGKRLKRLLKFNLICLIGLFLNVLILNLLFNYLGFNNFSTGRYIANLIAIGIVTGWNFWLNLKLSWRVTEVNSNKT